MHEDNARNDLVTEKESNFVLFDLNLKAQKIKNGYLIKDCITALSNFVDEAKIGYSL